MHVHVRVLGLLMRRWRCDIRKSHGCERIDDLAYDGHRRCGFCPSLLLPLFLFLLCLCLSLSQRLYLCLGSGLGSGEVEEQGAREAAEEAKFVPARGAGLCEASVEAFLERAFFACCYAVAVACLLFS
jgi:hypothetical protein